MQIHPELIEWFAVVLPAILAVLLLLMRARKVQIWCVKVLGSSAVSLVSIGLTLMRLTATCAPAASSCEAPQVLTERVPGIIGSCQLCLEPPLSSFWQSLWTRANQLELQAQAIVAAVCLGASLLVTTHFIIWCKKNVFSS